MKKNIAIIAGGNSGERGISLKSAVVVRKNIDPNKYNVFAIDLKGQQWIHITPTGKKVHVDKNDFSLLLKGKKIKFDCVFNIIHGTPGEDGKLQGYFDLLGIPYTTCGVATSALTFNKSFCKDVVSRLGVLTANALHLYRHEKINIEKISKEIGFPCLVKPNNGGSSIGMSKVNKKTDLKQAITKAFKEDEEILIEEYINGTEITCGVFKSKKVLWALPLTEVVSKKEFFDYQAKYTTGMAEEITPARISETHELLCKSTSTFLYDKLNCKGVVRFDYILNSKGLYFLEVNTIPGQSEQSIIPKQARAMGLSIQKLYSMLLEEAMIKD